MKLIKVKTSKMVAYLNADFIEAVYPYDNGRCKIFFIGSDSFCIVDEPLEIFIKKLVEPEPPGKKPEPEPVINTWPLPRYPKQG